MHHPLTKRALGSLPTWLVLLAVAAPSDAAPIAGSLDSTFGAGGKVSLPIAADPKHDEAFAAALDRQGRLLVAGYAAVANQQWALVRLLDGGGLDLGFGGGTGTVLVAFAAPAQIRALAVQEDGKIVAAGSSRQGTDDDFALARFLENGDRDPGFGIGGTLITPLSTVDDHARAVAIQGDGKIVAAGFVRFGANKDLAVVRYLSDGTPDPSFDGDGKLSLAIGTGAEEAYGVATQDDGKILLVGYVAEGTQDALVVRLTTTGALDPTFNGTGFARISFGAGDALGSALALQPDGRILVAGHARVGSSLSFAVARLDASGTLDPVFGDGGTVTTPIGTTAEGRALVLHPRGRFTVAGRARVAGKMSFTAAQYRADGSLDPTFGTDGVVVVPLGNRADEGHAIVRRGDGRVVVVGTTQTGSNRNFGVVRLLASDCGDGVLDPTEECDEGGFSTCCSPECTVLEAGAECRPASGACDVAETCDGASVACPADEVLPAETPCRDVQGACDVAEACSGDSSFCPADARVPAGVPCRAGTDACDPGESCDGVAAVCPSDVLAPAGTVCRPSAGGCDADETCTGTGPACPLDAPAPPGTVCRAVADACDVEETCDGLAEDCPVDAALPDGDQDGTCDVLDVCPEASDPAQADGDGDGLGDACDPCTNGAPLNKAIVRFANLDTPPGDDTVTIKGTLLFEGTRPALDPQAKGMRVIVEDANGVRMFDVTLPAGPLGGGPGPGWGVNPKRTTYRFKSPGVIGGLVRGARVKLPVARPRQVQVWLNGGAQDFSHIPAAAPLRVIIDVDPPGASAGHCTEVSFPGPAPAPACSVQAGTLTCR